MKSESRTFNLSFVENFTKKYHFNFKCDFYYEFLDIFYFIKGTFDKINWL